VRAFSSGVDRERGEDTAEGVSPTTVEGAEVVLKSTKRDDLEGRGGREGKAETKGAQTLGPIL